MSKKRPSQSKGVSKRTQHAASPNEPQQPVSTDISEIGQVGHLAECLGEPPENGTSAQGHGPLRRSKRQKIQAAHSSTLPQPFLESSIYFAPEECQVDEDTKVVKRRKPKKSSKDVVLPGNGSIFPTISLQLHGLTANKTTFYGLVQEILTPDVFGMTIVCILLNQTTGRAAVPVFYDLMELYPTPRLLSEADIDTLTEMLQPIGLHNIRAKRLKDFATQWVARPPRWGVIYPSRVSLPKGKAGAWRRHDSGVEADVEKELQLDRDVPVAEAPQKNTYPPTEISHLPGVGRYALDSFLLFRPCQGADGDGKDSEPMAMAAVQIDLLNVQGEEKPTSKRWQAILERREAMGESRDVGRLLPPASLQADVEEKETVLADADTASHDVWRHLLPLDKELRAYLAWRLTRDDQTLIKDEDE